MQEKNKANNHEAIKKYINIYTSFPTGKKKLRHLSGVISALKNENPRKKILLFTTFCWVLEDFLIKIFITKKIVHEMLSILFSPFFFFPNTSVGLKLDSRGP